MYEFNFDFETDTKSILQSTYSLKERSW